MICTDCGKKHGKAQFHVTTRQTTTCDWCGEEKSCVQDYKYGLERKREISDE